MSFTKNAPKAGKIHVYPSVWIGVLVWATAGFMSQPSIASFIVHIGVLPIGLFTMIWLARWEGQKDSKND